MKCAGSKQKKCVHRNKPLSRTPLWTTQVIGHSLTLLFFLGLVAFSIDLSSSKFLPLLSHSTYWPLPLSLPSPPWLTCPSKRSLSCRGDGVASIHVTRCVGTVSGIKGNGDLVPNDVVFLVTVNETTFRSQDNNAHLKENFFKHQRMQTVQR